MVKKAKGKAEKIAKNIAKRKASKIIYRSEKAEFIESLEDDGCYQIRDNTIMNGMIFPGIALKKINRHIHGIDIH